LPSKTPIPRGDSREKKKEKGKNVSSELSELLGWIENSDERDALVRKKEVA